MDIIFSPSMTLVKGLQANEKESRLAFSKEKNAASL